MNENDMEKLSEEFVDDMVTSWLELYIKFCNKYSKHLSGEDFYLYALQTIIECMHGHIEDKSCCIKIVLESMEDALEINMIRIKVSD
jgi:hypothetical protein